MNAQTTIVREQKGTSAETIVVTVGLGVQGLNCVRFQMTRAYALNLHQALTHVLEHGSDAFFHDDNTIAKE